MKTAIVGSRDFIDYALFKRQVDMVLPTMIISGGAKGADALAKRYALEEGVPYVECVANWDKLGKSAGMIRNGTIIELAEIVIAFWDGKSKGTENAMKRARGKGKPVSVLRYNETDQWVPYERGIVFQATGRN